MTRFLPVVLLLVCSGPMAARAHEPALAQFGALDDSHAGWRPITTKDGITIERRAVPGSSFFEHRAAIELPLAPEVVAEDVWRALRGADMANLKKRQILQEGPSELLLYDQLRTPVVSDRDYVIRVQRLGDPTRRRTEFRCTSVEGAGPPAAPGHVRIAMIRAGWLVEPGPSGGTRLTYFAYAEPGGLITAFIARGAQADRALADIEHMSQRLRRLMH
mgnify:CR=1 FL=1